jgi:hypothetical protein
VGLVLGRKNKYKPLFVSRLKAARSFLKLANELGFKSSTFYFFWRNIFVILFIHPSSLKDVVNLMAMYIHFHKQTEYIIRLMTSNLRNDTSSKVEIRNLSVDSVAG